ncbi:MAG: hypothetical protein ABFD24_06100 [Anaerolineaceae bacterium]
MLTAIGDSTGIGLTGFSHVASFVIIDFVTGASLSTRVFTCSWSKSLTLAIWLNRSSTPPMGRPCGDAAKDPSFI